MSKDGIESNQTDAEFEEFEKAGEVEVGESNKAKSEKAEKPAARRGPAREPKDDKSGKEAKAGKGEDDDDSGKPDDGEEDEDEERPEGEGEEDEDEEQEEEPKKKRRQPSDRIRELSRRLRDKDRLIDNMAARLTALEKGGLPNAGGGGKSKSEETPAPDPKDVEKYPLGHLDDRYIEDKLEWLAERKAADRADAVLLRQQEGEQQQAFERQQHELLGKVDDLAKIGDDLYDDFQEAVVEAGMRGDWDLSQPTFEAAHEADNGAQILYELSQDKKEASRVAKLSPYQQLKFVQERDAEITKAKTGRKIPKAGEPPKNNARGASSRTQGNPGTNDLDDFEKQWERDAKAKK